MRSCPLYQRSWSWYGVTTPLICIITLLQRRFQANGSTDAGDTEKRRGIDRSDSETSVKEEEIYVLRKGKVEFEPVEDDMGLFYKVVM